MENFEIQIANNYAPTIASYQARVNNAITRGNQIIAAIEKGGLSPEADELLNKYIIGCTNLMLEINGARSPITKAFDEIRSNFTALEKALDSTKAGSVANTAQILRNKYAKAQAERHEEQTRMIRIEKEKKQEAIDIASIIKNHLINGVGQEINNAKNHLFNLIKNATYDSIEDVEAIIRDYSPSFTEEYYEKYLPTLTSKYGNDVAAITTDILQATYRNAVENYHTRISDIKQEMLLLIPDLRTKLASQKLEVKNEVAEIMEQKQKVEEEKIAATTASQLVMADEEKSAKLMQTSFDEAMSIQILNADTDTSIRTGYRLVPKTTAAYNVVVAFWFTKFGANLTEEQLLKKTVASMVNDVERLAHKEGVMIDSDLLRYEKTYKAVTKKSA